MAGVVFRWNRTIVAAALACAVLWLAACTADEPASEEPGTATVLPVAPDWTREIDGEALATIEVPELTELSGMAASHSHPGIYWAHNDSGDTPRVFAFDVNGQPRGIFRLAGARSEDWEGMAVGPGPEPGATYLYLGDIGDNFGRRPNVQVYRIEEPSPGTPGEVAIPGVEEITLRYPAGEAHNAEALMVDPLTGDLFIVTKSLLGAAKVYRAAAPLAAAAIDLELVGELWLAGPATGADISPDGSMVVVRTYTHAYLWERREGTTVAEALQGEPVRFALEFEPQGEAIAFSLEGESLLTASEGRNAILYRYALWETGPGGR